MVQATAAALSESRSQEYLTFALGAEHYALDILNVQEIRCYEEPTRIANAPPSIRGVINLRGTIVPIVDLRIRFATGKSDYTPFTVVIIISVGQRLLGIIVDAVSDVVFLAPENIRPVPPFGVAVDTSYIQGMAIKDDRTLMVIHIDKLMQTDDMAVLGETLNA
jgi:purine-binding chemotaxis protein CheW